jgi:Outer membrane cobalamin receptor protein
VKDLIRYDFAFQKNVNVGRARMTGVEARLFMPLTRTAWARAAWTRLDTEDRDTGLPLLRRPKQRASLTVGEDLGRGASAEVTGLWVGGRDDVDATTYLRVTSPAYFRLDGALTLPPVAWGLSPFLRVTNLLGRDYAEVAGYPSPGRRFVAGVDVAF